VVSFPPVSPPRPCTPPSPNPYALHVQPISFFSILSPAQYWVRSTSHLAPRYVISSIPPLLVPPRSKYFPQHPVLKHPQLPFLPQCLYPYEYKLHCYLILHDIPRSADHRRVAAHCMKLAALLTMTAITDHSAILPVVRLHPFRTHSAMVFHCSGFFSLFCLLAVFGKLCSALVAICAICFNFQYPFTLPTRCIEVLLTILNHKRI